MNETLLQLATRRAAELRNADSRRAQFVAQQPKRRAVAHDKAIRTQLLNRYDVLSANHDEQVAAAGRRTTAELCTAVAQHLQGLS